MFNIPNKIAVITSIIAFIVSTVAYVYFFDFNEIRTIGLWRLPISLLSYLGGIIVLLILIFPAIKKGIDSEFLYGFRFEFFLLALCLFAVSVVLLKDRII